MRLRTFILLILVLLVLAVLAFILLFRGGDIIGRFTGGGGSAAIATPAPGIGSGAEPGVEPGLPLPTPTPVFQEVVVAKIPLPVGQKITEEMLETQIRDSANVALQGGYTFTDTTRVAGMIARVPIARGQEILTPMLAVDPTNVASFGSDLSLFVPLGEVAVALRLDPDSGAALAMRPGDQVDLIMTLRTVSIDPVFRSSLPNRTERVLETQLLLGGPFLFDSIDNGRLEFIPEINQVALIVPGGNIDLLGGNEFDFSVPDSDYKSGEVIPKRITQLTIQQANVLFVGEWEDTREEDLLKLPEGTPAPEGEDDGQSPPAPTPFPVLEEKQDPQLLILSMSPQDALALQFARERGITINLALRSPNDNTVFVTTSVDLAQ
ncbi:MAG TPA: hypothetical protein EYH05_10870, partial [Anaerolineae bacterium]|nr:hypothetical protein [Anaerolineae bacterium]